MKRLTPAGRLLADLIGVPSVNPAFARDPRTAGEERIAGFIADWAAKQGWESERLPVAPGRSNVVIRWRAPGVRTPRHRILLAPHLDTVGDAGGVPPQFEAQVRGGRMYGRGACDTKGSIASMLTALAAMNQGGPAPPLEIIFTGLVDEENGQAGSRALAGLGWRADLAIVGEPTRLQVVTAHKGDVWLRLETRGRAAHGATPHLGKNAVHLMARVVDLLETEYARQLQRRRHALLGCATVNVGSITGGTQPNIVPARCAITVDRRTLPGETEPSVRREVMGLLRRHGLAARWLSIRAAPCHPLETDARLPLVARLMRTARQRKPAGVHYFCDASVLARGGIPSVVFGPGDIAQAHTSDEWIVLAQVDAAAQRLERFFRSLT